MKSQYLDFDDVLPHAGEFGKYQWLLFLGLAPFCFNLVLIYLVHFFISLPPEHRCVYPQALQEADISDELRRNLSIPLSRDTGLERWSSCHLYDVDYSELLQKGVTTANSSWPTRSCDAWEFNLTTSGNYPSIVSELSWVCDREAYASISQTVFFVGAIVGGVATGWAADKYGRVPVLVATNFLGAVSFLLTATASSLAEYLVYRFIAGISFDTIFVMMYVLVLEYVGPQRRTLVANLSIALFYTAGTVSLPWLAKWVANWRLLCALSAVPMMASCVAHWVLPESARWLLSQGRVDETVEILQKIARVNGRTIPDQVLDDLQRSAKQETESDSADSEREKTATVIDLFRTPRLRRTTIAICLLWMLVSFAYDGHIRNVANLPLDVFVSFSVTSATELPADTFLVLTLDRWGRRWMAFGTLFCSGVLSVLTLAVTDKPLAIAILAVLGRFCVNISYNIGLQYAAELLPTVVRAQGVAAVHIMGYVASLLSPTIVELGKQAPLFPLVLLGAASIVGGIVALFLPETLHRDLPQTLGDGENFGRDQTFCSFPCVEREAKEGHPKSLAEIGQQPSFIRQHPRHRASLRGETYRSSLIRHRKEVLYIPSE
ncbi:organic cation transporter protein-like [Penaeus japonicus]|uniref:organic cation transporter protein-like n=1 Tax=Penaeus japonicus TaxID=27405 RepID=UPI001C70CF99|nr:organic cation transporter protein-like [Penaeus japonicus]